MTSQQVDLVQRTWRAVLPVGDTAAELFYGKLFSLDPSIRSLFKEDLRLVGTALLWTLEHVLGEAFTPEVRKAWTEVYSLLATTMQDACAVH